MKIRDNWIFTRCLRSLLWNLKAGGKVTDRGSTPIKRRAPELLLHSPLYPEGFICSACMWRVSLFSVKRNSYSSQFLCVVLLLCTAWYTLDLGFLCGLFLNGNLSSFPHWESCTSQISLELAEKTIYPYISVHPKWALSPGSSGKETQHNNRSWFLPSFSFSPAHIKSSNLGDAVGQGLNSAYVAVTLLLPLEQPAPGQVSSTRALGREVKGG